MYIYIHVYVYIYTYICIFIYFYIYICVYIYVCIYIWISGFVFTYIHIIRTHLWMMHDTLCICMFNIKYTMLQLYVFGAQEPQSQLHTDQDSHLVKYDQKKC